MMNYDELKAEAESTGEPATPYSTRSWGGIKNLDLPPPETFWGDFFAVGQLQAVIGQGGLGKSRMAVNLVRNQVLQMPFAGMDTGKRPLVHLMLGSENSIHRLQWDIRHMSRGLTEEQVEQLDRHIHLATLENPDDGYIALTVENIVRWESTIEAVKPDVLWVDPFGDVLDGDANSDSDTRRTLATLTRIVRQVNAHAGIVVLHHSRTGASNIMQATGFDSANFGKGSKGLYSSCRAVLNLAPYDESENPDIVAVCAKNNNAKKFEPFALTLEEETMTYEHRQIDVDEWREAVRAAAKCANRAKPRTSPDELVPRVMELVHEKGVMEYHILIERAQAACKAGRDKVRAAVNLAVEGGDLLMQRTQSRPPRTLYGTREQLLEYQNPQIPV